MARSAGKWDTTTAERTIYFYRLNVGVNDAGDHRPFPTQAVLQRLNGLSYEERLVASDRADGPTSYSIVDHVSAQGRMRLAHIRHQGLPQIEEKGALRDLDLSEDAGLVEVVQVRFFPDNIVGAVFNFYGPRPARLGPYLAATTDGICPRNIRVEPLLRQDVADRLDELQEVRVVDLRIHRTYADRLQKASASLARTFHENFQVGGVQEAQIILRSGRERSAHLGETIVRAIRRLARLEDLREGVQRFRVKGRNADGILEELDVLRDDLLIKKRVPLAQARGRALDTDAAYEAIASAHRELSDDLSRAATISPEREED